MSLGRIFRSMMGLSKLSGTETKANDPPDFRGIPTAACPSCGCEWFKVLVTFDHDTYEIDAWALDGECLSCGTLLTVVCPVDAEERELS